LTEENNGLKRTINEQQQQITYLSTPLVRNNSSPVMNVPSYPTRNTFVKIQNFTSSEVELPPSLQNTLNVPCPSLLTETPTRGSYPPTHNDSPNLNPLRHSMPYRINEHPTQFIAGGNELSKSNPRGNMAHRNSDSHLRNDPSVMMAAAAQSRAAVPVRSNDFQRVMAQLELTPSEDYSDTDDTTSVSTIWTQYQPTPPKSYQGNIGQSQQQQLYRASLYPVPTTASNGKHSNLVLSSPLVPPQTHLDTQPNNGSRINYNYM